MNVPSAPVALQALLEASPDSLLAKLRSVDCSDFWTVFAKARDIAMEAQESERAAALDVLAGASSLILRPADPLQPFAPLIEMAHGSSARPEAYRGPQAETFGDLAPSLEQPALRARLADLAWVLAKRADAARVAIDAYLECIQRLVQRRGHMRGDRYNASTDRALDLLARVCVIQRQLGGKDQPPSHIALAKRVRDQARRRGDGRGYLGAAELALNFGLAKPLFLARAAEKLASKDADFDGEHVQIGLLEHSARAYQRAGRKAEVDRVLIALAERQVQIADRMTKAPFQEVHWLELAIATLRQIRGTNERRAELQARLIRAQGRIGEFMMPVSTKIEGGELVDSTRDHLEGLDLCGALLAYCDLSRSPFVPDLYAEAAKSFASTPLAGLFAPLIFDPKFKVASRLPAIDFAGQPDEGNLRFKIIQHEEIRRAVTVAGQIEPGRMQIVLDHQPDERTLIRLASASPLVPPGHELFFGRGFTHFFNADFIEAAHLLLLQLEPLLRHVLVHADTDITRFRADQTQSSATLSVLLNPQGPYRTPLESLLGEATIFEIENLFDRQEGPALRHRLAHGLLTHGFFGRADTIYACWFMYRLCIAPLLDHEEELRHHLGASR
ncbi:hypothetical protein J3E64_001362 [Sphingobium sp. OAS761]|uniref:DUF7380 domain-containing protein n=1 Tax=Sphingobium sp. OAS761 TaxID=2817901 RepID=UPI00209DF2B6|nr:hypothetical protein [Sphingobium sp. OAS761]MCP1469680.1 hypothetical protein [Sphingobium sp. OAS761]